MKGILLAALLAATSGAWAQPVVHLATLEWPPYNGAALPEGGLNTALVRAAFAAAGWTLKVDVMPWARARQLGAHHPAYDGYFPKYAGPEAEAECRLPPPAGTSPLALAARADTPPPGPGLAELSRYRLGVVNGYSNGPALDASIAEGRQRVEVATSDRQNLVKLLNGRLAFAVIDRNVFQWFVSHDAELARWRDALRVLEPTLAELPLVLCLKKTARGNELAEAFARGLASLDVVAFTRRYLARLPAAPGDDAAWTRSPP